MAKIFKFTGYFVDSAGECSKRDVKTTLEEVITNALDIFSHHVEVKDVELGEWDDSHPLNMCDCSVSECEKYFGEGYHG